MDQTPGDRKGSIYHYHTDPTGTPREVTDENGKLVWQASYSAWGRVRANLVLNNGREFEQPLRLPGQYHDAESGLHYNTFRYYDAHCGKFISSDPIGLVGGLNLYQYAPNPFKWIDPLGLIFLFRSMSIGEYNSLMSSGEWTMNGASMTGKWFAESYSDAVEWGNRMGHGGDAFRVVQVDMPDSMASAMHADPHLDGIGPARYAELGDLNNSKVKIKWSKLVKYTDC